MHKKLSLTNIRLPHQNSPMDPIVQPRPDLHFLTVSAARKLCPAMTTQERLQAAHHVLLWYDSTANHVHSKKLGITHTTNKVSSSVFIKFPDFSRYFSHRQQYLFNHHRYTVRTIYTVSQKNRTLVIFSNISNKSGPILIIFGTENRQ